MRISKRSTMPLKNKGLFLAMPEGQNLLFAQLKEILKKYEKSFDVRVDSAVQFELWTEHEFRTSSFHPKRQRGVLFAGIAVKNSHVGLYYYPLHLGQQPEELIPPALKMIKKGKSTFHFTSLDFTLRDQLEMLLSQGYDIYDSNGWIFKR
jgi:hypothetical protein